MRYQRTQVYLEPEDHARLVRQAAERGISLAALMREIVASHAREGAPSYGTKSIEAIIGIGEWAAGPDDSLNETDRAIGDALWEEYVEETAWLPEAGPTDGDGP